jgi:hypothetical protein
VLLERDAAENDVLETFLYPSPREQQVQKGLAKIAPSAPESIKALA